MRGGGPAEDEIYEIQVVDMFGLVPSAPWKCTVAIKIRVLEAYRVTHVRCPQLAIQSFVKALCDMHGRPYRPYLCQQFSIAYDLYLDLRRQTDERVMSILGRDSSWRLKHACPACTYKLEGEDALIFEMLTTMDGNDSLKRVLRREKRTMADEEAPEPTLANPSERLDNRDAGDGYFIARENVEKWAKTRLAQMLPMAPGNSGKDEDNPCADRWKNMINDVTSKMWGVFDETGIFLALCRHGFVLVIADMLRSGELAKYPLAVVKELLNAFGMKLGAGYDVACHFEATVRNSELGDLAREKKLKCLVGSFHGHAHNRLCQLGFLANYVDGMGLEDLEGCERFFSRSNGLARSCRYASRFHRQQEISTYVKHFDSSETYANLSKFLCNNYHQALTILKTEMALKTWMRQEGVLGFEEFHQWLEEEKVYLLGLKRTPETNIETMEMEYVQRLAEIARRHGKEKLERDFEAVEDLESRLDIVERWTTVSPQWASTVVEIKKRKYQLALGELELLIVERIFELTKTNQSQTGYKMRKHIAKALQARSKAVRRVIETYNTAALALDPPMPTLSWEQVVEYTFLADFDILRDTDSEVQSRPWTRPAYRLAMDRYFRILRAREEIRRLNIEIRRVVTWIADENRVLRRAERRLRQKDGKTEEEVEEDTAMAVQVRLYRERRGRFDNGHMRRFWALSRVPGCTATMTPGISALQEAREELARAEAGEGMNVDETVVIDAAVSRWRQDEDDEWEEEGLRKEDDTLQRAPAEESDDEGEGEDERNRKVSGLLYRITMLAVDDGGVAGGDEA
ncbi:hypothetical protein B0H15DRAFT_923758 [Mycena belliarum]|uniref:CxC1-like cysteine cluster associated with KDZ transposases domain-containing protein n=1 Tax=Mycena belliarum TaxID=1033014 RepID=A0AAD6XPE8_9AGAR|nr:hypothetical protein B0H15DRAFT_923758 [Mycena belliae]